jgi:antitoxin VapB
MAFHIKDEATDKAVRRLTRLKRKTLTETIRESVEHEYERVHSEIPLIEWLKPIQDQLKSLSKPGGCPATRLSSMSSPATSDVSGRLCDGGDACRRD